MVMDKGNDAVEVSPHMNTTFCCFHGLDSLNQKEIREIQ